jgi:uncharacterized protein (DUF2336 family)
MSLCGDLERGGLVMLESGRSLIGELDRAIQTGVERDRVQALRSITDLFLASSPSLSDAQIELFDEVIGRLIKRVENRILAELSERLAPIANAPIGVVQNLARHDEIAIAGPVLAFSLRLSSADLIEIATSKGQAHLRMISTRTDLTPMVTDVLLDRGNADVLQKLVANLSARFSDEGMIRLIDRAEVDQALQQKLGLRLDLPLHLLRRLLELAPDHMRRQLVATASSGQRCEMLSLLQAMGLEPPEEDCDLDQAKARLTALYEDGELDETVLIQLARHDRPQDLHIALAILCAVDHDAMEQICQGNKAEDLLMPCRAAGVSWYAFQAILAANTATAGLGAQRLGEIKKDYIRLSLPTAQRVLKIRCRQLTMSQAN